MDLFLVLQRYAKVGFRVSKFDPCQPGDARQIETTRAGQKLGGWDQGPRCRRVGTVPSGRWLPYRLGVEQNPRWYSRLYIYIYGLYIYMGYIYIWVIYIYMGYIYIYGLYIYIWVIYIYGLYIYIYGLYIYIL